MLVVIWDTYETPQWLLESKWARESGDFASEGYVKHSSFVALSWHTFLIEPSGFWNLRKWGTHTPARTHTHTHIYYDELGYAAYNGDRKRCCDLCLSFAHSFLLSEVSFFFSNCVTTGTRDPMDGVLRNPVECCNKKLFPIDLLPSQ